VTPVKIQITERIIGTLDQLRSPYHSVTHLLVEKIPRMAVVQSFKELLNIQFKHPTTTHLHQLIP